MHEIYYTILYSFQIEDPEEHWIPSESNMAALNNGPPPPKKKKYKSYDIALENISDGGNNG